MRKLLVLLLFAFCFAHVSAQELPEALTQQSSTIKQKLQDLKMNSAIVTEQLITLSEDLKVSQQEAQEWKERSMSLSSSLMSINEQLNDSYETIIKYEAKTKTLMKILSVLLIILIVTLGAKLVAYILYFKGVKLPRWLDILL